jgi:exonuclease III
MKIVSWNVNMAFRKKKQHLLKHDPDVLLIQECEYPEHNGTWVEFDDWEWVGDNKNKGIGIYTRNGYTLERIPEEVPAQYFLPVKIPEESLTLVNVWAMNNTKRQEKRYIGQLWTALQHYDFVDEKTVIAGDINWNVQWDSSPKYELVGNYMDVITKLNEHGLCSVYHKLSGEDYGDESEPTFFMHRKEDKPFHTDHIFLANSLVDSITEFEVGAYTEWSEYSDHMPIIIEFTGQ